MKKYLYIVLAALMLEACGAGRAAGGRGQERTHQPSMELRVGSYNLWRSDLGKGEYAWELRKDKLARAIACIGFDIFGIQEVDTTIQRELPVLVEKAGGDYEWFVVSPYSEDGKGSKAQGIVYRKSRFEMLESHRFWLSPTPDVMSSGWDEMKFRRGAWMHFINHFCVVSYPTSVFATQQSGMFRRRRHGKGGFSSLPHA